MIHDPSSLFNPEFDLKLERTVSAPVHLVWKAITDPSHLRKWFVPRPWTITEGDIELYPGGAFIFTMQSPEGEVFPSTGCVLEVIPEARFAWTDALKPGFRPSEEPFFSAVITLEPIPGGTKYTAFAKHKDTAIRTKHAEMGFHDGWGTCFDQLVELLETKKV